MIKKGVRHKAKGIRCMRLGLCTLLFLCVHSVSFSQSISATLDRDKIVLGEQVSLQLKVEDVNAGSVFITQWFSLPDTPGHFTILKKDALDTVDVNGLSTYIQHITITSFDSGRWAVPLQAITIKDRATGKQTTLKADSLYLQVLPVDVSALKDYHDIKDIIDVPAKIDYTLWIAAAASIIIVAILIVLFLKRKKRPAPAKKAARGTLPPLESAIHKLKELEKEGLPFKGQTKLFFIKLDDICREYFTARMHINAMQLTSDELLPILAIYLQDKQAGNRYNGLMQLIDAVKFAKYAPELQEHTEALQLAAAALQHIDKQLQMAIKDAN